MKGVRHRQFVWHSASGLAYSERNKERSEGKTHTSCTPNPFTLPVRGSFGACFVLPLGEFLRFPFFLEFRNSLPLLGVDVREWLCPFHEREEVGVQVFDITAEKYANG